MKEFLATERSEVKLLLKHIEDEKKKYKEEKR